MPSSTEAKQALTDAEYLKKHNVPKVTTLVFYPKMTPGVRAPLL